MDLKYKLNNGLQVPAVGLGTWKSQPNEVYEAVKYAVKEAGYRHLDCAFVYQNEEEVGRAVSELISTGVVKREELFITSKVWNTYHSSARVGQCLQKTLDALKVDYLDLYLVHWPMGYKEGDELFPKDDKEQVLISEVDYVETWKAMEKLVEAGKIKSIGVSNFNEKQIDRVLSIAKIKPVMNQVECHPYLNQEDLLAFCKEKEILLTAYSPLGTPDRPWAKPDEPTLLNDPALKTVADKYGKTTAQILIKFQVQRGLVVIPKSVTPARILQNTQIFDFTLSDEDLQTIRSFNRNYRFLQLAHVKSHPHYPF